MALTRHQPLMFPPAAPAAAGAAGVLPSRARTKAFERPRILYGFEARSSGDITPRRVVEKRTGLAYARIAASVENKPGANGRIALDGLKAALRDKRVGFTAES